jgi:hypothetical protein
MSDLKIALIAEGPTDRVVIESALKAILSRSFIIKLLQPEATRPDLGAGWGGVLKWCREFRSRGFGSLEDDPTLEQYDLFILHIDADVSHFSYTDLGGEIERTALEAGCGALPCSQECPPPVASINRLKGVLFSWLGIEAIGNKTVLCIPSKSSEAWLASAVYPGNRALLENLECAMTMEARLAALPKGQKIRKNTREYLNHANTVKTMWPLVRQKCSRADTFHLEFDEAAQNLRLREEHSVGHP